jgi:hypothetical protein
MGHFDCHNGMPYAIVDIAPPINATQTQICLPDAVLAIEKWSTSRMPYPWSNLVRNGLWTSSQNAVLDGAPQTMPLQGKARQRRHGLFETGSTIVAISRVAICRGILMPAYTTTGNPCSPKSTP